MKLRYKLLLAFFITTSITGISTTIFAIQYFSSVINQEAVENMERNIKVSKLIYQRQLKNLKAFAENITYNRGFQLFTQLKVTDKLTQILRAQQKIYADYYIQVFDSHLVTITEAGLENNPILQTQLSENAPSTLLQRVLIQKETLATIETLQLGQNTLLSLITAAPIFDDNNYVGILLVRQILPKKPIFAQTLEQLLSIKVTLESYSINKSMPTFMQEENATVTANHLTGWQTDNINFLFISSEYLSYNQPLFNLEQEPIALLGIHLKTEFYEEMMKKAVFNLLSIMVLCISVTFILAYLIAYNVLKPLRQLLYSTEQISSHDFLAQTSQLDEKAWHHALPTQRNDELGKLAQAFSLMAQHLQNSFTVLEARNKELQHLNQLKDEFLANNSHELKTPIQGIIGLAESLRDQVQFTETQQRTLAAIIHSGHRLANLVNDILDFSRLRHRDIILHRHAVNLRSLVDIVILLSQPLIDKKPINLNNAIIKNIPLVYADENRLQQILHNLIGNAIKFTEQGDITISASVRSKTEELVIKVRDTGIGLTEEVMTRMFEPFEQGNGSTARRYGGTGLGLAITRRLVELHDGKIWVTSEVGKGSIFYFSLPLDKHQVATADTNVAPAPHTIPALVSITPPSTLPAPEQVNTLNNPHILVVDDDPLNRQVLVNHLSSHHYHVTEAYSGQHALQLLHENTIPDLILLDVMMPNMTGYEVTNHIRQYWNVDELPIVLLTAKTQVSDVILGLETGANDYLLKPISKEELLARLRTHLKISELRDEKNRLELQQAQFLEAMPIAVKILEVNGKHYYSNQRADALNLNFNRLHSQATFEGLYYEGSERLYVFADLPLMHALKGQYSYADNLEIRSPNQNITLECWAAPVWENEQVRYVIAAFQEITHRKQAETELRASETRFRQLMETMSTAMVIVHRNGAILYANRAAAELTGYSLNVLHQLSIMQLVHPDYRDEVKLHNHWHFVKTSVVSRYELPIINVQHHVRWLDIMLRMIDYQGRSAILINALDITERKTTTELLNNIAAGLMSATGKNFLFSLVEYLAKTLQVSCVFIGQQVSTEHGDQIIVDFISTNEQHHQLEKFTYALANTPSQHVLATGKVYHCVRDVWRQFPTDPLLQSLKAECFIGTPLLSVNGYCHGLMALVHCQPLDNYHLHESALQIFAARAVAELERQTMLEALEAERESLAERVQARTSELSRANVELARAARLKDEFLANMSHELRTPLNAILGLSEALQEGAFGELNARQLRSLTVLSESGRHLLELINDILDLAKIEANKIQLNIAPTDIKTICEASLRLIQEIAKKKRIRLESEFDIAIEEVMLDSRRLKQILVNLLSNAIKFTQEGGTVSLKSKALFQSKQISLKIIDTGIGIRAEDIPRLFRPFEQLDGGLDRAHEGTGLGLALVQRLVEMHGGHVSVQSALHQGSCFTIILPWHTSVSLDESQADNEQVQEKASVSPSPETSTTTAHILLVDDNPINVKTFADYLDVKGYQVTVAQDGVEALEKVTQVKPQLILMDVQMPRMDGITASERLRANPETQDIPIIALTALAMPGDREKCLAAGMNAYLSKPVRLPELVTLIEQFLQGER